MRTILAILFLFGLSPLFGAESTPYIPKNTRYGKWLQEFQNDPKEVAQKDFDAKRFSVYTAMGVGPYYPGIDFKTGDAISEKYTRTVLPGFSDAIESQVQGAYMTAVGKYASAYNIEMVRLLKQAGMLPPVQ